MSINMQPKGLTEDTFTPEKLLVGGIFKTKAITLKKNTSATALSHVRGRMLNVDTLGKYHAIDPANSGAVSVVLTAATEVTNDAVGTSALDFTATLAHPPIPGTVTMATTADGSGTVKKGLGTDNGEGVGIGTSGSFQVDYETGRVQAHLDVATSTATDDLKAGYQYLEIETVSSGVGLLAMPKAILAEDITYTDLQSGDVVTVAYVAGEFNASALKGYNAGYDAHLRKLGLYPKSIQA